MGTKSGRTIALGLPLRVDWVPGDQGVGRQQAQSIDDGLANENPVKGVPVEVRQLGQMKCCLLVQRKAVDVMELSLLRNIVFRGFRQRQSAQFVFYGDLPGRSHTQVDFIFRGRKKGFRLE